jgi:hypothetical protein
VISVPGRRSTVIAMRSPAQGVPDYVRCGGYIYNLTWGRLLTLSTAVTLAVMLVTEAGEHLTSLDDGVNGGAGGSGYTGLRLLGSEPRPSTAGKGLKGGFRTDMIKAFCELRPSVPLANAVSPESGATCTVGARSLYVERGCLLRASDMHYSSTCIL